MGYIPHPPIPLGTIRPYDIIVLLTVGAMYQVVARTILMTLRRKPTSVRKQEVALKKLEQQVVVSRSRGPSHFVETSKLERQQLAESKVLSSMSELRQQNIDRYHKVTKYTGWALSLLVFVLWYQVPIIEFSSDHVFHPNRVLSQTERHDLAVSSYDSFLFPLSYVGVGVRVSKWGLANPRTSIGALLVVWSAQVTVDQVMDGIEALML